jgi:hypothetical protein
MTEETVAAAPSRGFPNNEIRAWYSTGGSLMVSHPIEGVTQDLSQTSIDIESSMTYYQGRFFVCETIRRTAAERIACAMGWKWVGVAPNDVIRSL